MCLSIRNTEQNKPKKPQKVYKVYSRMSDGSIHSLHQRVNVNLHAGRLVRSNRSHTYLTQTEQITNEIFYGLHVFTNKKDAYDVAENVFSRIVVEFVGHPEDFVARGTVGGLLSSKSAVYTKLRVLKVYRKNKSCIK